MTDSKKNPRILIITPEVTYLPDRMGDLASHLTAKAGGLADVSAALVKALFDQGADVHVALPDYRSIFSDRLAPFLRKEQKSLRENMPEERIHLVEDRAFFYLNQIYSGDGSQNIKLALTFQRDVINYIIPRVKPDLIHCNDWMTALIPAMARELEIPCLFTIHNIHTVKSSLAYIEDRGIDAAYFWRHLYFQNPPQSYEESRDSNLLDFLTSGIFAAHFVNTVSPTFLKEIVQGRHSFVEQSIKQELTNKWFSDCAVGILNAPDPAFNPLSDPALEDRTYGPENFVSGKIKNKLFLQESLGLIRDEYAPVLFWPSRLDPVQKGCELLAEILYKIISSYWEQNLEIVFVANGEYQPHFRNIARFHNFENRVAICDFDEHLEHLAYGASDFVLMPSRFEPCGLPQMIGPIYGTLPIAHDTGGIHDTVVHMTVDRNIGNGFLFETYDSNGLFWAVTEAMRFYNLPDNIKNPQIKRIMEHGSANFNHDVTAQQYIQLYEKMLQRPLINRY
ncbi:Putative glycogen synthase, GlgA-like [Desulfonema limicola]|uniref:starch synthase n=1 Tax=Desulfonema limicola TaxID=45656 RepID=A0A975BB89_9BACT|nr:glycogen/starch synthase [Desulfonema limicola]QTA82177.1 Putative glycogen synthase, GlgA-like [Desulfonema limicola]